MSKTMIEAFEDLREAGRELGREIEKALLRDLDRIRLWCRGGSRPSIVYFEDGARMEPPVGRVKKPEAHRSRPSEKSSHKPTVEAETGEENGEMVITNKRRLAVLQAMLEGPTDKETMVARSYVLEKVKKVLLWPVSQSLANPGPESLLDGTKQDRFREILSELGEKT